MPDRGKANKLESNNNWQENAAAAPNITQHKHYDHFKNRAQRSSPKKHGHHGHPVPHQIPLGLNHKSPTNNANPHHALPRKTATSNTNPQQQQPQPHISPTPAGAGGHLPGGGGGGPVAAAAPANNEENKNPAKPASTKPSLNIDEDYTIRNRWVCQKKLGSGGFGEVWRAFDKNIRKNVAVKMEALTQSKQVLKMEVAVLKKLQSQSKHVCKLIDCGRNQMCNYMIMTLLGHSLADLRRGQASNAFTVSTALRITRQMLFAIRDLHNVGYLHRDIKPSNFAIGLNNPRKIYMFDFGLARVYMVDGKVREARSVAGFRGTVRYASLTAHKSKEMGRGDDLWSLFYIMLEFVGLNLPWKRIKARDDVGKMKDEQDHRALLDQCERDFNFPASTFYKFLDHIRALEYASHPDYDLCDALFQQAVRDMGFALDDPYDWEKPQYGATGGQSHEGRQKPGPQAAAAAVDHNNNNIRREEHHGREGYGRDRNSHGYHRSPSKGPGRHKASSKPRDTKYTHGSSGRHAREVSAPPVVQSSREPGTKERVRKVGKIDKNDNNNNNVYRGRASESRDHHPAGNNVNASLNLTNMIRGGSAAPDANRFQRPTGSSPNHMILLHPNKITDNVFGEAVAETREDLSGKTLSDLSLNKGQDDTNRNENNSGSNDSRNADKRGRLPADASLGNLYKNQQKHFANYRQNRYPHTGSTAPHTRAKQRKSLPANYTAPGSANARGSPVSSKPGQSSSSLNNASSPPPPGNASVAPIATAAVIPTKGPTTTTLPATIDLAGFGQPLGTKPVVLSTSPLATGGQSFHHQQQLGIGIAHHGLDGMPTAQDPMGFYPMATGGGGMQPLRVANVGTTTPIVATSSLPALQPQHSYAEPTTVARNSQLTHHASSASTYTLIAATSNLNLGKPEYIGQQHPQSHQSQLPHGPPQHSTNLSPQAIMPMTPINTSQNQANPATGKCAVTPATSNQNQKLVHVGTIAATPGNPQISLPPQGSNTLLNPGFDPDDQTALSLTQLALQTTPPQPYPSSANLLPEPQHTIETASAGNVSNIRRNFEKWGAASQKRPSHKRKSTGQVPPLAQPAAPTLPGIGKACLESSPSQGALPSPMNHPASAFMYQTLPKSQSSSCINDLMGAIPIGGDVRGGAAVGAAALQERNSTIYTAQQLLHDTAAQSNGNTPPTSGEPALPGILAPTSKVHPPVPVGPRASPSAPNFATIVKSNTQPTVNSIAPHMLYSSNNANNQSIENTLTTNNTTGNTHSGNKLKPTPPRTQRQNSGISGRIRRFNQLAEKGGSNNYSTQTSSTTGENIKS